MRSSVNFVPMTRYSLFLLVITCLGLVRLSAQDINIHGTLKDHDSKGKLRNAMVIVFQDGKEMNRYNCNDSGIYNFLMPVGHEHTLRYSCKRYFSKIISIDSRDILDSLAEGGFEMKIDGTLLRKVKKVDARLFEEPIAIAKYDEEEGAFAFDFNYTEIRQAEIEAALGNVKNSKRRVKK